MLLRSSLCAAGIVAAAPLAAAHDGVAGEHLNIGFYYGHDGSFEAPADPPLPPTLLVDTHPWELGDVAFMLEPVSNALLDGWQTTVPGFDTLPVDEQEFGGHGFYSWMDPASGLDGDVAVMLHLVETDPRLQVLSPFTLQPLPAESYLGDVFHMHAIFYVDAAEGLAAGEMLEATFRLTDANGVLDDSEPFTLRFGLPCKEDLDGDGTVGVGDLNALLFSWETDAGGDIDGDGVTDIADLNALLFAWENDCAG